MSICHTGHLKCFFINYIKSKIFFLRPYTSTSHIGKSKADTLGIPGKQLKYTGRVLHHQSVTVGSPQLQSHGWLTTIIKVFGHFPWRSRRSSWWHSCIPKHGGGNYNEVPIHPAHHDVHLTATQKAGKLVFKGGPFVALFVVARAMYLKVFM